MTTGKLIVISISQNLLVVKVVCTRAHAILVPLRLWKRIPRSYLHPHFARLKTTECWLFLQFTAKSLIKMKKCSIKIHRKFIMKKRKSAVKDHRKLWVPVWLGDAIIRQSIAFPRKGKKKRSLKNIRNLLLPALTLIKHSMLKECAKNVTITKAEPNQQTSVLI
jgi:hypothetical protein